MLFCMGDLTAEFAEGRRVKIWFRYEGPGQKIVNNAIMAKPRIFLIYHKATKVTKKE